MEILYTADTAVIKMHAVSKFSPKTREERSASGGGETTREKSHKKKSVGVQLLVTLVKSFKEGVGRTIFGDQLWRADAGSWQIADRYNTAN